MNLALYCCEQCKYSWQQLPDIVQCPRCGWLYVEWVNYEEWRLINGEPQEEIDEYIEEEESDQ